MSLFGRRGIVGIKGVIYNTLSNTLNSKTIIYLIILELKAEQNLYIAKLAAILIVIKYLLLDL